MDKEKAYKLYDTDDFLILDVNNDSVLNDLEIDSMYLKDSKISYNSVKLLYNDIDNPLVLDKSQKTLYINPEYFLNNSDKILNIILNYIKNYKRDKLEISEVPFINDEVIDAIVNNSNIKEVSLAEYGSDNYVLTLEHYKKFKEKNIRVGTKYVCDELKENFDDIIKHNSEKNLIRYFKYRDLINKKGIYSDKELTEEELYNLKYINPNMVITLDIDNYEHINVVKNRLKELGKDNVIIKINLSDKKRFNDYIFNNEIDGNNIRVETPDLIDVSLNDYLEFEKILYLMIKNTDDLSPFEKYIYAYNITKQFKIYKENENNKNDSRKLYSLLVNQYMVCVGFSRLFGDLLDKMGIENKDMNVSVDESYDKASKYQTDFNDNIPVNKSAHARRYVHIVDPKYGIDGYYIADPTWDNSLEHDFYNHLVMTDNETTLSSRYVWLNKMDIFNVNSIEDFINKLKIIRNKKKYEEFVLDVKDIVDNIKDIDVKSYDELYNKYNYISKSTFYWPDNITELVYDLGNIIVRNVNKTISGDIIFSAIEQVYRHSYGYSEEELDSILIKVREENTLRQSKEFPERSRINQDGSMETILNEENKFESVRTR